MKREIKVYTNDLEVKGEVFGTAERVSPIGGKGVAYSVNVCRYLKALVGEDFVNEIVRTDGFTSVVNECGCVCFVADDASIGLPTIHKFMDYLLQYYEDYDFKIEFGGKVYDKPF